MKASNGAGTTNTAAGGPWLQGTLWNPVDAGPGALDPGAGCGAPELGAAARLNAASGPSANPTTVWRIMALPSPTLVRLALARDARKS
jgi:hypothetical protein